MSVSTLLNYWQAEPTIADNITTWHILPARQAQFLPIPKELHPDLDNTLSYQGIQELYTHQALSWCHVTQGKNIVIATGTASGKTLCYNLPVLDHLLKNPEARALYLFPTKALAQDQAEAIRKLLSTIESERNTIQKSSAKGIWAIYDGDTPPHARSNIRKHARLVLSNPDMLHIGILPYHTKWVDFFANLHYVVIDEMHIYRGVFGSHVANVIRRLKRIAQIY
jgi:DEAD/DEAH box helicase domain-containing protein